MGLTSQILVPKKPLFYAYQKSWLKSSRKNFNINIIFSKTSFFTGFTLVHFLTTFLLPFYTISGTRKHPFFTTSKHNKR